VTTTRDLGASTESRGPLEDAALGGDQVRGLVVGEQARADEEASSGRRLEREAGATPSNDVGLYDTSRFFVCW
jgi:hypothetical protein